jgi:hypothetical protein
VSMKRRLGSLLGLSLVAATFAATACGSDDDGAANAGGAGHESGGAGGKSGRAGTGAGGSRAGSGGSAPSAGKGGSGKGGGAMGGSAGHATAGESGAGAGEAGAGATGGTAGEQAGASGAGAGGEGGAAPCDPEAGQTRVVLVLDQTFPDWVKDLEWTDSSNVSTGNVAAYKASRSAPAPPPPRTSVKLTRRPRTMRRIPRAPVISAP